MIEEVFYKNINLLVFRQYYVFTPYLSDLIKPFFLWRKQSTATEPGITMPNTSEDIIQSRKLMWFKD